MTELEITHWGVRSPDQALTIIVSGPLGVYGSYMKLMSHTGWYPGGEKEFWKEHQLGWREAKVLNDLVAHHPILALISLQVWGIQPQLINKDRSCPDCLGTGHTLTDPDNTDQPAYAIARITDDLEER